MRFVGEAVAYVIAETLEQARDAAEQIAVDYEVLPAAVDIASALAPDAPLLWDERGGNLLVESQNGDRAAIDAAFARAHKIIRLTSHNQRVSGAPMEPRCTIAAYDQASGSYTIHSVSQGVHRIKFTLAACLGVPPDKVRVITGDVGGGFGVRSSVYPEYAALAWAARKVGRPVKWNSSRAEAFLADYQARDVEVEGALALDKDGKFLALQLSYTGNLGAYPVSYAVLNNVTRMAGIVYDIPAQHVSVKGVATNTVPMSVYRGAGRPESNFILERMIDLAAAELGIARDELRRRNIIPADSAALSIAARPSLRLRRLRREYGKRAEARRLGGLSGAARGSRGEGPAARHRGGELSRNRRPASSTSAAISAFSPKAASMRRSARKPRARAMRRASRKSSPISCKCRWSASRCCSATPPSRSRAAARIPIARCASAARCWCAPRPRSSRVPRSSRR